MLGWGCFLLFWWCLYLYSVRGGAYLLNFRLLSGNPIPPTPLPASSQSPFMLGADGKRPPLTSLPCSSFSAKRHAKVACSVVNALTTALFCYHLFAVLRAVARFLWGQRPATPLRGQAPLTQKFPLNPKFPKKQKRLSHFVQQPFLYLFTPLYIRHICCGHHKYTAGATVYVYQTFA